MYLTYNKRPELMMFDEDLCMDFPVKVDVEKLFWMLRCNEKKGVFAYYRGHLPDTDRDVFVEQKQVELQSKVREDIEQDITDGVIANAVKNIYYVSSAFSGAFVKTGEKIAPLLTTDAMEKIHEDACFVFPNGMTHIAYFAHAYYHHITILQGMVMSYFMYQLDDKEGCCNDFGVCGIEGSANANMAHVLTLQYYQLLLFKKYGNVELETVTANKTLKRSQILGEKVNNFMGIDVKVLDSRWFTTICRDEGFLVSGHFRLQPCKDENGEWTRKLIYINPYAKHGYHRLAPIVNLKEE